MALRADKDGFLMGSPIELGDIYKGVNSISGELAEIKELLRGRGEVSLSDGTIKDLTQGFGKGVQTGVKEGIKQADSGVKTPVFNSKMPRANIIEKPATKKTERIQDQGKKVATPIITTSKIDRASKEISEGIAKSTKNSLSEGITTYNRKSSTQGKDTPIRGANGRFLKKGQNEDDISSSSDRNSVGSNLKNIGKGIIDSVGDIANAQADQSDPSLQALGEVKNVFAPLGRGFGKIFSVGTGGVSRGQDRWYRRFFKQRADKNRIDDVAEKRQRTLLTGIYKRSGTKVTAGRGVLATLLMSFLGLLATMLFKVFRTLSLPVALLARLFGPLLKALSSIAKVLGLNRIFGTMGRDRVGSPSSGKGRTTTVPTGNNPKGKNTPKGSTAPFPTTTGKDKPSKVPPKSLTRGALKKIPWLGALLTAGFLTSDLKNIESDETKTQRERRQAKGTAIGGAVGGMGGMIGGATIGASIGSVVPIIGTAIGGIVGGIVGSIGGDYIGSIIGEKFGGWTDSLIESDVGQNLIFGWNVATETMSLMWTDFTAYASQKWDAVTQAFSTTWMFVSTLAEASWNRITNAFEATTGFIQSTWSTTSSLIGGTLSAIGSRMTELAKSVGANVKEYTGIDLPKHISSLKSTVGGWVDSLKGTVKDVSASVKDGVSSFADKMSTAFSGVVAGAQGLLATTYIGSTIGEAVNNVTTRNSTTKEQDENQTKVLNAMMKAGFTKSQAVALTAEVGRENDYNSKYLYGGHTDASNGAHNIGMISWQGSRAKKLQSYLESQGLWKNGKMVQSQEALDAQARFMKMEIDNNSEYSATKNAFARNPNADPEAFAEVLGKNYIRWAYGQDRLRSGKSFAWRTHDAKRRGYKEKANSKAGNIAQIPYKAGVTPDAPYEPYAEGMDGPDFSVNSPEVDPNSLEGMMQTFNNHNAMGQIQQAVVSMLKENAETGKVKRAEARTSAVVPALTALKTGANVPPAPTVQQPLANNAQKDSNAFLEDVTRDLSDSRIAHVVSGAYSKK